MSEIVVVDASFAVKWVIPEDNSKEAKGLLDIWIDKEIKIIAPNLFAYEVTNILYRKTRAKDGSFTYDRAYNGLEQLFSVGVSFISSEEMSKNALKLADKYKLPATYDAHYLALASHEDCEFWTADAKLWRAVKADLSWVHCLGVTG